MILSLFSFLDLISELRFDLIKILFILNYFCPKFFINFDAIIRKLI